MLELDEKVTVSAQVQPGDMAGLAAEGYRAVICNRPDGEEPGQPNWDEVKAAAEAQGMSTYFIPMTSRDCDLEDAEAFAQAMAETDGKVFAYCRSGARCQSIWAAAKTLG